MMPEEVYQIWAPADSEWSPWAIPVPFAQMTCVGLETSLDLSECEAVSDSFAPSPELAMIVDLPGELAIKMGLALALQGFRPVPVIDGSPGPGVNGLGGSWMDLGPLPAELSKTAVDMRQLLRGICQGASILGNLRLAPNTSPVFLLDAMRMAEGRFIADSVFDNRWKTFPQDYPSARFLQERGIRRVVVIQERAGQPQEDLSHVLLRWEEAGMRLEVYGTKEGGVARELRVNRPSHFRMLWQRALAMFGLRRGASGGFGDWPHGSGGG